MNQKEFDQLLQGHLAHPDDQTAAEIAEHVPMLDDAAKNRVAALCEEKLRLKEEGAMQTDNQICAEGVTQITGSRHFKVWGSIAACLLAVIGITSAFLLNRQETHVNPLPPVDTMATDVTAETTQMTETTSSTEFTNITETTSTETLQTTTVHTVIVICTDITQTDTETAVTEIAGTQTDTAETVTETITETTAGICSLPLATETTSETATESFVSQTWEDSDEISITYPLLNSNTAQADAINALIWARVDGMIQYCLMYDNPDLLEAAKCSLHVDRYTITRNDAEYLSIIWEGYYFPLWGAHPNIFVDGLVIDKKTLSAVTLSDLYNVDESFCQLVQTAANEQAPKYLADQHESSPSDFADIRADIYESALPDAGNTIIDSHAFFLTETGVGTDASVLHVFGDYVKVIIPYEDLETFKK